MKKLITLLFLIGICFLAEAINSVKTPQLTIGFLQNKGQILNPNGQVNKEVLFHLNSEHAAVQLRENGFSYTFFEADNGTQAQRVDIDFVGANTDALKEMHDKNEGEEDQPKLGDIEIGIGAMIDKHGLQQVLDTLARMSKA